MNDTAGGVQWILPSIDPVWRRQCIRTMHQSVRERCLVVDNSTRNRGVAASWNLGRQRAINERAEWLVLLSESVRFGTAGGLDLEDRLEQVSQDHGWVDTHLGWHLVAFRTFTLIQVGAFDENFHAYMEDSDYLIRLHLAGFASPRENSRPHLWLEGIDAEHTGTEHSLRAGLVTVDFGALTLYWRSKWATEPPKAATAHPFGDSARDWTWWPPRP